MASVYKHLQEMKHEVDTMSAHGDVLDMTFPVLTEVEAAEYHIVRAMNYIEHTKGTEG